MTQIVPPELVQLLFTIFIFRLAPMAETIPMEKVSLSPKQQDSDRLMKQLEEEYNMPHEKWWNGVETAFQCLRMALERGQDDIAHEEDDPESISPQAARADALPLISLLPSGSHALRLTATDEDLQCVAFGTISAERFVEIFWEAVARTQDEGDNFVVFRIDAERSLFWFNFRGYNFQLLYLHCEQLVRSCPRILEASDEDLQVANARTRKVVEGIKRDTTKKRACFVDPYKKAPYYYLRAWAIAQGRYTPNERLSARTLQFQELIKIIELGPKSKNEENPVFAISDHISEIFQNLNENTLSRLPLLHPIRKIDSDCRPAELLSILQEAEDASVDSKLQTRAFVQVNLMYWGSSELACGKWLSMVERKLSKLKERLETTDAQPDMVRIWPQRLLDLQRDPQKSGSCFWAGCYVLGLQHDNEKLSLDQRTAQTWEIQVERDKETPKHDCSIKTVCMTADEFQKANDRNLVPCPRKWPRPSLSVDREKYPPINQNDGFDQPKKSTKHQKKSEQASNEEVNSQEPHRGLRTARAVLNRLKHDRTFSIDEFKVGYLDRHTEKVQEKPVAAWVTETTDDLFIPEHRIVWFKRCLPEGGEVLVWDKAQKIDRIFANPKTDI